MLLLDVNVLLYAHREEMVRHRDYRLWLEEVLNGEAAFGIAVEVLSAFLRVATHPRIFNPPTGLEEALRFTGVILQSRNCVLVRPGSRHWEIFTDLCRAAGARGNLVADAYLAALALESGCEWITTDRDFNRFPNLRWRHPLT
jgi:hypothetical protein